MMSSVIRNAILRPVMSPIRPNTRAPRGRTANPTAKVARVFRNAAVGFPPGKNWVEMIVARLPKM
jgi:hypothetical protein